MSVYMHTCPLFRYNHHDRDNVNLGSCAGDAVSLHTSFIVRGGGFGLTGLHNVPMNQTDE